MIPGVLQRLTIIELTKTRLVLREQPLLEWFIAAVLLIAAANLALFQLWLTALAALILGVLFVLQAHIRLICFDASLNAMMVEFVYLHKRQTANTKPLNEISHAYLHKTNDGSTQIILVDTVGNETGLSVYSNDMRPWKEDIVVAINAILHEAHKEDVIEPVEVAD